MEIVEVEWTDAGTNAHETTLEEAKEGSIVQALTVGYLVKEDEEQVVLLMTQFPEIQDVKFRWEIPRSCIKSIRKLQ